MLRRSVGEKPSERYIETVPKRGYRFVAAIRTPGDAPVEAVARRSPPGLQTNAKTRHYRKRTLVGLAAIVGGLSLFVVIAAYTSRNSAGGAV